MKVILLLICIICTYNTHSQINTRYFLDDVELIEYVTLEVCADSINGVHTTNLIKEKTTYTNQSNINGLMEFLKNEPYPQDGYLIDTCGNITFSFINSKFENLTLNEEECQKCEKFKKGEYNYSHINFQDVTIKRRGNVQKEMTKKNKQTYDLKWISNCSYVLTYKRFSQAHLRKLIGEQIDVEIIKYVDENTYVYRAKDFKGIIRFGIINRLPK